MPTAVTESMPSMKRIAAIVALMVAAAVVFVADQARRTLGTLDRVERERDGWQRPADVLRHLDAGPGDVVVDLGSGAGYFALKLAPQVAPGGRVLAVDLRRQSLAFLWMRAVRRGYSNVEIVHAAPDDPLLPPGHVDAALIANTYHELAAPAAVLTALARAMRSNARLVVVDRSPRQGDVGHDAGHHDISPEAAEQQIAGHGFERVTGDASFIDRPGEEDVWWLLVFRRM